MESEPREDSRAYLIEREDRLSQVTSAVLAVSSPRQNRCV
jgi:hypothetical protein